MSEAAAWVGGTHEAGSETISYVLSWLWSADCEGICEEQMSSKWRGGRGKENENGTVKDITVDYCNDYSLCFDRSSLRRDSQSSKRACGI